eukprot:UN18340
MECNLFFCFTSIACTALSLLLRSISFVLYLDFDYVVYFPNCSTF